MTGNATILINNILDENPVMVDGLDVWEQMSTKILPDLDKLLLNSTSMAPASDGSWIGSNFYWMHYFMQENKLDSVGYWIGSTFKNLAMDAVNESNKKASLIEIDGKQQLDALSDATSIMEGILVGVFDQEFSNVGTCITDASSIYSDFSSAVSEF